MGVSKPHQDPFRLSGRQPPPLLSFVCRYLAISGLHRVLYRLQRANVANLTGNVSRSLIVILSTVMVQPNILGSEVFIIGPAGVSVPLRLLGGCGVWENTSNPRSSLFSVYDHLWKSQSTVNVF